MSTMSATVDNLFGTTPLEGTQAALIKKTYALLTVSLVTAVGGGYIGATSLPLVQFFASPIGWLMAMIMINAVPRIALWASTKRRCCVAFSDCRRPCRKIVSHAGWLAQWGSSEGRSARADPTTEQIPTSRLAMRARLRLNGELFALGRTRDRGPGDIMCHCR